MTIAVDEQTDGLLVGHVGGLSENSCMANADFRAAGSGQLRDFDVGG
jgi:hypothetical protein